MDLMTLVAKLKLDATEYADGLDDAKSEATGIGSKIGGALSTAAKVGVAAIGAASGAAVAFGKTALDAGMNFDTSMSQVAATMGTTVDQIGNLRDFAQEMGSTTAFSASEAADALNVLAMAGYSAEEQMATLPSVLSLASAGGLGIAQAADYATGIIAGFGLEMEDAGKVADTLAKVASSAKGDVSSFGEGLSTVAGMAATTGQKMEDMTVALGILGNNNVAASEAGNALSRTLKNLYQPTDSAYKAMDALGVSAYDATGAARPLQDVLGDLNGKLDGLSDQEKNNILSQIFDAATLKTVPALLNSVSDGMGGVTTALQASGVEWEKYADTFWYANKGVEGVVDDLVYNITDLHTSTADLVDYLTNEYEMSAEDAMAAINAVSSSVESQESAWDSLSGTLASSTGAAEKAANEQLNNLAGDITIFKSALEGLQITVADVLKGSAREFVQFGSNALSALTESFKSGGLDAAMETLGTLLSDGLKMLVEKLPGVVEAGMKFLSALGQGIIDNLPVLMETALQLLQMFSGYIVENLPALLDAAVEIIFALVDGIIEALPELIPAIVEVILTIVEKLTEPDTLMQLIQAAFMLIEALGEGMIEAIPALIERIPIILLNIVETFLRLAPQLLVSGTQLIVQLGLGMIAGIAKAIEAVVKVFASIKDEFKGRIKDALQWGKDLISNFVNGIKSGFGNVRSAFSSLGNLIKGFIHFSEPDVGPLSDFHTYAPDMMKEFAEGIKNNEDIIRDQIEKSFYLRDAMSGPSGGIPSGMLAGMSSKTGGPRQLTVILELDRMKLGKAVYTLNSEEEQRVGVNLALGGAV